MNRLLRPLCDFRFQIEGSLIVNRVLSKTGMYLSLPASALLYSVLCNRKSAIDNLQSIIVLPAVLGSRTLRRTVQIRLGSWISDFGLQINGIDFLRPDFAMSFLVFSRFSRNFQSAFCNPQSTIDLPVAHPSARSRDPDS